MAGLTALELIETRRPVLAEAIAAALYAARPELAARYGETGRARCLEDINFNLDYLAGALRLGDPTSYADYIAWVRSVLEARAVPAAELAHSLRLTTEMLTRHGVEDAAANACIAAALERLDAPHVE